MEKLWKMEWDGGRGGMLTGVFVATDEQIETAKSRHIYFGEVLGKHSEVEGDLEDSDLRMISDDQHVVKIFKENIGTVGYSPLDYMCCEHGCPDDGDGCEECYEEDEAEDEDEDEDED